MLSCSHEFSQTVGSISLLCLCINSIIPGDNPFDTDSDISFPTLNPAYMGIKPKHSFAAYSLASWLQNPLSSMETDIRKDKHLDSLSPPCKKIQAGGKAADQQGHRLPPLCKESPGQRQAVGKLRPARPYAPPPLPITPNKNPSF